MTPTLEAIQLAGTSLEHHRHVCAFFHTRDEEYRVLLPFIKDGIRRGDRALHIVDPLLREDHLQRLRQADIDIDSAAGRGQFEVRPWPEAYLRQDRFDQDKMLELIEEILQAGAAQGYPLTRLVAHMEWSLEEMPGVEELVEYETRLNYVLPRYKDPVICTYDCAKFGAGVVMDILRTHPMVIIGGMLQQNPFYVPPDEFLEELRSRGKARAVA